MTRPIDPPPHWLAPFAGAAAERLRGAEMAGGSLGAPHLWPADLRALTGLMLAAKAPRFLVWGPSRLWFCNDACAELLGPDVLAAIGHPADQALAEVRPDLAMLFHNAHDPGIAILIDGTGDASFRIICTTLYDDEGTTNGLAGECVDIRRPGDRTAGVSEQEQRYRALLAAADTGFCIVELRFDNRETMIAADYRFVEINAAFERMTGFVGAEGRWIRDLMPDLQSQMFERYGRAARTGEPIRFEHYSEALGRYYDLQAFRIGDPDEHRVAILFNDITERRQTEARHAALVTLGDALRDLDDPDAIAYAASEVLGRALGVSRVGYGVIDPVQETLTIGRDWTMPGVASIAGLHHFRDYGSFINDLKAGRLVAINDARTDARTRDNAAPLEAVAARALVNLPLIEQGEAVALLFANHARVRRWRRNDLLLIREVAERVRAATERARSERLSREREEQFRVFAEAVPDHVWSACPDGGVEWINQRFFHDTGARPEELSGTVACPRLLHPDDLEDADRGWQEALRTGIVYENECRMVQAGGGYQWYLVRAEPVRDPHGAITRWVGTNTNIHERRTHATELARLNATLEEQVAVRTAELMEAEAALRQSQKMEAVGQLTGGLAHDFNNLLTNISGSLELLGIRLTQGRFTDVERYSAAAQAAARRATALTHRLLAFSRRQTLDPRPTDVNRLVTGMEDLVRRTAGPAVEVEFVAAVGLWPTLVDPNQLENALLNLCINARDAMPDGGRLTVETGNRWLDVRAARERDLDPGQYISLCVSDTGTGMTPEVQSKAFDPFYTTKPLGLGTGLGLSMIYGFARQSGGQVRIYSEPDQGTMICIYLPRHLGEAEAPEVMPDLKRAPRADRGETVLIVDDEPTVRMLVSEVLEDLGYTAIEAADGAEGLRILQSDVRIDLLVSDVGLPGGMNGRQMADAGRVARPDLTVLFITGYAENAVVGNGHLDAGMHVMTKPFALEALATRIKALIQAKAD